MRADSPQWLTAKAEGDRAELAVAEWFRHRGYEPYKALGLADFDLLLQCGVEVKHDLQAPSTGNFAIAQSLEDDGLHPRSCDIECNLALPDQEKFVRGIAFTEQILPGGEAVVARASARSWMCSWLKAAKNGCSLTIRSSPSIADLLRGLACPDGGSLFCNVYAYRAPSDAPAAADATGGTELIDPVRQFVGHPLPVARGARGADGTAVDVGKIAGKAGVPLLNPRGVEAVETALVFHRGAEAGGANHGAIAAGKAAASDVLTGMGTGQFLELSVSRLRPICSRCYR
jgi:hypothetical protein